MKQKAILKDGVHAPKRSRFSVTKSVVSKVPLSTSISTTKIALNASELNIEEANSEESIRGRK